MTNPEKQKLVQQLAKPLVDFLRKEETPMTTAIVTGVGVEVVSTDYHVPFDECSLKQSKTLPQESQANEALIAKINVCKYVGDAEPTYLIELSDGRCFKCVEYAQVLNDCLTN